MSLDDNNVDGMEEVTASVPWEREIKIRREDRKSQLEEIN